jgi:hypothetical protein
MYAGETMAIDDFPALLRLLDEHPEWRDELRRRVLDDEFLRLPALVRQNSRDIAQNSADIRELKEVVAQNSRDIAQNSADIRELKEVVAQNSRDIAQNSADIRELKEVVAQNSRDIAQNSADVRENSFAIRDLAETVRAMADAFEVRFNRIESKLGRLDGRMAEFEWDRKFAGRFGRIVRRSRLRMPNDLVMFEDAHEDGRITDEEADAVRLLDLIIEGIKGKGAEARRVLLAVEISTRIEENDIARAIERAAILRKVGYDAVPVVGGSELEATVRDAAAERGVEVVLAG